MAPTQNAFRLWVGGVFCSCSRREGGSEGGTELNPAHQFCKETVSFLSFPYVSPEPVLVKSLNHPLYIYKWHLKKRRSLTNDPTFLFQTAGSGRENANAIDTVVSILLLLMIRPEPVWANDSCISMSKTETKTRCVFCFVCSLSTWSGSRGLRALECERCSHA